MLNKMYQTSCYWVKYMYRQHVEARCPKHCVGHLAPEQKAEDLNLSKARESLQVCYNARIYDCQLFK
ncbi:hypothetical protein A2U01_0090322, partial [Trifolium medium]|nr:hypothetical protein [Trifolium medium]